MAKRQKKNTYSLNVWLNIDYHTREDDDILDSFNEKKRSSYKRIDYEGKLNPEQQEVVFNLSGNILVKSEQDRERPKSLLIALQDYLNWELILQKLC